MVPLTLVFLKLRKKPTRELLGDHEISQHRADLRVLVWSVDFSNLADDQESAEMLWTSLGQELLQQHRDPRGVLSVPSSLAPIEAKDYASAVATYSLAGLWLPNIAQQPAARLVAADESEIPLPRFPKSKLVELYVVKAARAMRELDLTVEPFRTVRLELRASAAPRDVSAFYLPLLKAHGLTVKRRIWSSGAAERLVGSSAALEAFVVAERRGPSEVLIRVSWVLKQ